MVSHTGQPCWQRPGTIFVPDLHALRWAFGRVQPVGRRPLGVAAIAGRTLWVKRSCATPAFRQALYHTLKKRDRLPPMVAHVFETTPEERLIQEMIDGMAARYPFTLELPDFSAYFPANGSSSGGHNLVTENFIGGASRNPTVTNWPGLPLQFSQALKFTVNADGSVTVDPYINISPLPPLTYLPK